MYKSFKNLLNMIDTVDSVYGRKKLQKMVFILKHKGFDFDEKFEYHYYGPYSPALQVEIEALIASNLLIEEHDDGSYKYYVSDDAKEYLDDEYFTEKRKELIQNLNREPAYILELVSVFFYLADKGYSDQDILMRKVKILKPALEQHIPRAYGIYCSLKN